MNLISRLLKPGQEIERFNISQYLQQIVEQGSYFSLVQSFYAPAVTYSHGKPTERVENSYRGYVYGAYKVNPIVYGLMKRRSSLFSEARFMWRKVQQGKQGDLFWNKDLALLETPWPNGTTGELLTRMIQDVDLAGNFYAVNEGDRLRRLRPDWTQIILSGNPLTDNDIDVIGYVYTPNGPEGNNSQVYTPAEICHWSPEPDPDATYRGMSWITPVVREIQGDNATTDHKNAFFRQGATFGPIVKAPPGMTRKQFEEFIEASESAHAGKDMAYKTMYLAGGSDVELIRHDFHQLDFTATVGKAETRMCVAAGVPAVIAGVSEGLSGSSLNAGNFQAAKRDFVDGTMRTLWRSACAALSTIVNVPAAAELWYDESAIAYLREDERDVANINQVKMATILQGVNSGFDPDGVVKSVAPEWSKTMPHSGLMSVQLQPPGGPGEPDAQQAAAEESGQNTDQGDSGDGSTPYGDESDDGYEPYPPDSSRAVSELVDDILRAMVEVEDDLVDEFDEDDLARAYNASEARIAKGHKGAGQFGSKVTEAIEQHLKGGGKDETVLSGLSRPSLVNHAKKQGLNPQPRMERKALESAILAHARQQHAAAPAHKSFSVTHGGKTVEVGVYMNPKTGKLGVFQETNGKKTGRALTTGSDIGAIEKWATKNGHTDLAAYAKQEGGAPAAAHKAPAGPNNDRPTSMSDLAYELQGLSHSQQTAKLKGYGFSQKEIDDLIGPGDRPTSMSDLAHELQGLSHDEQTAKLKGYGLPQSEIDHLIGPAPSAAEAEKIASAFHEDWRKTRLLADGSYDPRGKTTTDQAWIAKHGTDQVDIANTSYADLPKDWQAENKAAADVVASILAKHGGTVDLNDPATRAQVGEEIHQAWLGRNTWAKGGALDVPFDQLPPDEQAKDLDQVTVAMQALGKTSTAAPGKRQLVDYTGKTITIPDGGKLISRPARYGGFSIYLDKGDNAEPTKIQESPHSAPGKGFPSQKAADARIKELEADMAAGKVPTGQHAKTAGPSRDEIAAQKQAVTDERRKLNLAGTPQLRKLAAAAGLPTDGNQSALVKRLLEHKFPGAKRSEDPDDWEIARGFLDARKHLHGFHGRFAKKDDGPVRSGARFTDPVQRAGLHGYTETGSQVNAMLRQGKSSQEYFRDDRGEPIVRGMDAVFADPASHLAAPITVSRGVRSAAKTWGGAFDVHGDNTGLEWEDPGYVSTTTDEQAAVRFAQFGESGTYDPREKINAGYGVVMHVHVPAGTPAVSVGGNDYDESEVALPRGGRYRITHDSGPGSSPRVVEVDRMPPRG